MIKKFSITVFFSIIFLVASVQFLAGCAEQSEPQHATPSECKAKGYKGVADYGSDLYFGSFCSDGVIHGAFMYTSDGDKELKSFGKNPQDIQFTELK